MPENSSTHLYLPDRDRSFWDGTGVDGLPLLYLAWGHRNFYQQTIPVSRHDGWVCAMIEEGAPILRIGDEEMRISAGHVILIGPDCAFGWRGIAGSDCKFILWMWKEWDGIEHLCSRKGFVQKSLSRPTQQIVVDLHDMCRREILNLDERSGRCLTACRMLFESTMERVIHRASDGSDTAQRVASMVTWLNDHLDSQEPVARLCDYFNLSQSSLYRLFKNQYGTSPAAYFHQLKMTEANRLLEETDEPVKVIAFTLGYTHPNDFSRAFKSWSGKTPDELRGSASNRG